MGKRINSGATGVNENVSRVKSKPKSKAKTPKVKKKVTTSAPKPASGAAIKAAQQAQTAYGKAVINIQKNAPQAEAAGKSAKDVISGAVPVQPPVTGSVQNPIIDGIKKRVNSEPKLLTYNPSVTSAAKNGDGLYRACMGEQARITKGVMESRAAKEAAKEAAQKTAKEAAKETAKEATADAGKKAAKTGIFKRIGGSVSKFFKEGAGKTALNAVKKHKITAGIIAALAIGGTIYALSGDKKPDESQPQTQEV